MNSRVLTLSYVLLMLIALLSGCATVDQKVTLDYKPVDRPFGRNSGEVFVSRTDAVSLLRNTKGEWIVGSLNNVHGVRQADLLSDRTVGEWVSDALLQELKQAGYTAGYTARLPAAASRAILISNISVFMNVNQGTVSSETRHELKFDVDILRNGSKVKTFTIAARDNSTIPLIASLEKKELIMRQSLQDGMRQLLPELIDLFNKQ